MVKLLNNNKFEILLFFVLISGYYYSKDYGITWDENWHRIKGQENLKDRVVLKWGDATEIGYDDNTFDVAAMAFGIRNIPDKVKALNEMKRVVLPDGQILILELTTPDFGIFKSIYSFYLNGLLPKIAKRFTVNQSAYEYLADSIMNFPTRQEFISLLDSIGLRRIRAIPLSLGICTLYIAIK